VDKHFIQVTQTGIQKILW